MAKAPTKAAAAKPATKPAPKATKGTSGFKAKRATEITASFRDAVGLTANVAAALAAAGVNILASTGYSASAMYRKAVFTFLVDKVDKAEKALEKFGADDIEELSVVLVDMPNKVGALEKVTRAIADAGINISYYYVTVLNNKTATCVLKTMDDEKAIKAINKA